MSEISKAEQLVSDLERRVTLMELGSASVDSRKASDNEEMRGFKLNILTKLKTIRDKLVSEGGDPEQLKKERDEALAENIKMKKEMEKQAYRIKHLIKELSLEEAMHKLIRLEQQMIETGNLVSLDSLVN